MKDPAFLFYSSDFLSGTMLMSNEEVGIYIKLLCLQHQQGHLKEEDMLSMGANPKILNKFVKDNEGNYYNERLEYEAEKRHKYTESRRNARLKCDEDQVRIYLILDKDTKYIKIGSSVNPQRRFAEMCNQKNPAITVGNRNYELIFISRVLERKIEKELHELYQDRNITGEWFDLKKEDINYIRKTYEETYEEHTENENINENINLIKDNSKRGSKGKKEEEKIHFAEFVTMTNAEYEKLVSTHGKDFADQCITALDNYKGSKNKKYASDYRAILSWVVDKVKQTNRTNVKPDKNYDYKGDDTL